MTRFITRARSRGAIHIALSLLLAFSFAPLAPAASARAQGPHVDTVRSVRSGAARTVVQCQKCHADRAFLTGKSKTEHGDSALFVPDSLLKTSRHAKLSCGDCHPAFNDGYPHNEKVVAVACQKCHEKEGNDWTASVHAPNAKTKGDAPTCVGCHGKHDVLGADNPLSRTYALNVSKLCGDCHNNKRIIGKYFDTARGRQAKVAVVEYEKTVHSVAMAKSGLVVSATCNDCHGAHLVLPRDSARSTINRANIAQTCGTCHAGVLATFDSSSHGQALVSHKKTDTGHEAPVCIDCHKGHQVVAANDSVWFRGVVKECGSCHEKLVESYTETYHGQVTALGFGYTAKCSDCHTAHAMLPARDPRSSVNQANLVATCSRCHPGANAKFVQYQPHAEPQHRAKNPGLFIVWAFMTALLVGVFLFFGSHSLLWLMRLTINRLRGGGAEEHPKPELADEENEAPVVAPPTPITESKREPVGSGARRDK